MIILWKSQNGYDETQAYGEFEKLPAGGYKCKIKKVVEEETKNGKKYIKVGFDIEEGKYKEYYQKKFANDKRKEPKWSGIWTIFENGYEEGTTNTKFVGFITSIEESNEGFKFNWEAENNEQTLKDKKVGIVFREEEFIGTDGQVHTGIKPSYAVSYEKAEEAKIPNKKELPKKGEAYEDIINSSITDEELPF